MVSKCVSAPPLINKVFWGFFIVYCIGLLFLLISIGLSTNASNGKNAPGGLGLTGLIIDFICLFSIFVIFIIALFKRYYGDALKYFFLPFVVFLIFSIISSGILSATKTPLVIPANAIAHVTKH